MICSVCTRVIFDEDEAHTIHDSWCSMEDAGWCTCSDLVHPECCTEPGCRVVAPIPGQLDLLGVAR